MKRKGTLVILPLLVSLALAEDFKTTNGKEYKNATASRVEPNGVVIKFSGGIVKIPFTELPKELQEKYQYNPSTAQGFAAVTAEQVKTNNAALAAEQLRQKAEKLLSQFTVIAIIDVKEYGQKDTIADIQPMTNVTGEWTNAGSRFRGTIDDPMPKSFEQGSKPVTTLYRIGDTQDSFHGPLFTTNKEKAIDFLLRKVLEDHR